MRATQLRGIHATRVYKKAQLCKYCQMFGTKRWLFYVENGHDLEEEEEIYWAQFDYKYMNNYIRVHKHIGVVLVA